MTMDKKTIVSEMIAYMDQLEKAAADKADWYEDIQDMASMKTMVHFTRIYANQLNDHINAILPGLTEAAMGGDSNLARDLPGSLVSFLLGALPYLVPHHNGDDPPDEFINPVTFLAPDADRLSDDFGAEFDTDLRRKYSHMLSIAMQDVNFDTVDIITTHYKDIDRKINQFGLKRELNLYANMMMLGMCYARAIIKFNDRPAEERYGYMHKLYEFVHGLETDY